MALIFAPRRRRRQGGTAKGLEEPGVYVNSDGTYMVVQNEKELTIVKLAS